MVSRPAGFVARCARSPAVGVAAFLALGFVLFCSTGHDDSHITYWAAHTLAETGQILNFNGERVEQSSSLAQVVLLAGLTRLTGVSLPTLGPITSIGFGAAAILAGALLAARAVPEAPRGLAWVAATTPCFVYWGFGGMETTLVAAAALWLVLAAGSYLEGPSAPRLALASCAMASYLAARPESSLVLVCLLGGAGVAAWRAGRVAPALHLAAVAAIEIGALLAFRWSYFGALFPNPVYSKATGIDPIEGFQYLGIHLVPTTLWLPVGGLLGTAFCVRQLARTDPPRIALVLSVAFTVAYFGFIILVGGDWMFGGRFLVHALPVACVVCLEGLVRAVRSHRLRTITLAVLVVSNLAGVARMTKIRSSGRPLWTTGTLRSELTARVGDRGYGWFEIVNLAHLRDATVAAEMVDVVTALRPVVPGRRVVVMSAQAGMVPYHLHLRHGSSVRFIDNCSLVTRDFVGCLPDEDFVLRTCKQLLLDQYFAERERIDAACGTTRPDVILGLGNRGLEGLVTRNGYTIVYSQYGRMRARGDEAYQFVSDEFIAVDAGLATHAGIVARPPWVWDIGVDGAPEAPR